MSKAMHWRAFVVTMVLAIVGAVAGYLWPLWDAPTSSGWERVAMVYGFILGWIFRSLSTNRSMTEPGGKPATVALVNQPSEPA